MGGFKTMSRKNRDNRLRRRLFIAGLAVFLLFDVVLVSVALTTGQPTTDAGAVVEPVASAPAVEPTPTPVETTAAAVAPVATVAPTRILAALDATTAWRATTGACPAAPAAPELTTDSGATWDGFNAAIDTDASSILAINVFDEAEASLVTLNITDCAPQLVSTFVAGEQWRAYSDRVDAEWYVDPATSAVVHSPSGDVTAPCGAVATLAATDDTTAAVLCTDASVFTTVDAGATWSAAASVPGAAALTASTEGYRVAVVNPTGCTGISLVTISLVGALDSTPAACVSATVNPGEVALSAAEDGTLWLWAGDAFARSTDNGVSWA
ncbi:hypothetical protein [Cryobacterium sp. CG_9.6]|uniref:hypothetical protein n=1 Tax=Cryobacterium sp. CG_9.6 TaxID=2760710 RepID=UPI0024742BAC|nr:hypothetical protein [Cryobacterium sp. CG_9.6]MDH6235369.1 hypothetical protein [Cryobacterium sp. CG_9.6]